MLGDPLPNSVRKLVIRKSHPALYRALMVLGSGFFALALNFWLSKPTFSPYGVPKEVIGVVFFLLGSSLVVFLNVRHDLTAVRITLATSVGFMLFWGASNTQQWWAGNASLQLPILYMIISVLQFPLLIESPINPMTKKK